MEAEIEEIKVNGQQIEDLSDKLAAMQVQVSLFLNFIMILLNHDCHLINPYP